MFIKLPYKLGDSNTVLPCPGMKKIVWKLAGSGCVKLAVIFYEIANKCKIEKPLIAKPYPQLRKGPPDEPNACIN